MTSTAFFRLTCIILLVGCSLSVRAQEYKYEIGGMVGTSFYMGDVNQNTPFKGLNPAIGGVLRYNANFRWALKGNLMWSRVSGSTDGLDNVFPENASASFNRDVFDLGGQAEFNFFSYSDKYAYMNTKRFAPYILVGLGMTVAPGSGETFFGLNLPVGVGMKYKVKNRLNLGVEFTVRRLFGDGLDVTDGSNKILDNPYHLNGSFLKNNDWYSYLLFSVTWDFSTRKRPCNNFNSISAF